MLIYSDAFTISGNRCISQHKLHDAFHDFFSVECKQMESTGDEIPIYVEREVIANK